ncbi:MAG: hypothetical protein KC656_19970, partial [Myxococcales bacterium]|nr:hypothetical protein [Myxococcales bacterium]
MVRLVELGTKLQQVGTECAVLGPEGLELAPAALDGTALVEPVRQMLAAGGDLGSAFHVPHRGEWLRAEPLARDGDSWLVAFLPRTCQHVLHEAERLQN